MRVEFQGVTKQFKSSINAQEILKQFSVQKAIAVKVNGKLRDLHTPLYDEQIKLEIITADSPEGLGVMRHSTSHIMATAIKRLFSDVRLAIGPPIEDGFYYDIDCPTSISESDLPKIEEEMKKIIDADLKFERFEISRKDAIELFKREKNPYKVEIIEGIKDEKVLFYKDGEFVDLCEGPHVPSAGWIKAFKLLKTAGAYWRGSEKNPMLQRIYGTAFHSNEALDQYLEGLKEAARRDHRRLGKELDLFSVHEEVGSGLIHWHQKASTLRRIIEETWYDTHLKNGYQLVYTPHIASEKLYKISGHLELYSDLMYSPMDIEGRPYRLKPMNCPGHIMIYKTKVRSYRDLPLRMAELGTVYRFERSGVLHGLLRVRGFTIDDAHIFVTTQQVQAEVIAVLNLTLKLLRKFGFSSFEAYLSTKPENSIGRTEDWQMAQEVLKNALLQTNLSFNLDEGGGAFYGPKIDVKVKDAIGRSWQLSTIQFDFNLPERFDVTFVDHDNTHKRPFMIHRAIFGSLERFLGVLIEHYAGEFPLWLAPLQVVIIPMSDKQLDYSKKVQEDLLRHNFRTQIDSSNERLSYKIKQAILEKIPYMIIIGDREVQSSSVSIRHRKKGDLGGLKLEELIMLLDREII